MEDSDVTNWSGYRDSESGNARDDRRAGIAPVAPSLVSVDSIDAILRKELQKYVLVADSQVKPLAYHPSGMGDRFGRAQADDAIGYARIDEVRLRRPGLWQNQ